MPAPYTYISEDVYNSMSKDVRLHNDANMWTWLTWDYNSSKIYRSS